MNAGEGLDAVRGKWKRAAGNREERDHLAVLGNALRTAADAFPGLTVLDIEVRPSRVRRVAA